MITTKNFNEMQLTCDVTSMIANSLIPIGKSFNIMHNPCMENQSLSNKHRKCPCKHGSAFFPNKLSKCSQKHKIYNVDCIKLCGLEMLTFSFNLCDVLRKLLNILAGIKIVIIRTVRSLNTGRKPKTDYSFKNVIFSEPKVSFSPLWSSHNKY